MKKKVTSVTKADSFAIGRIQGSKEVFEEMLDFLSCYPEETPGVNSLRNYIRGRIRNLHVSTISDAFKQKDLTK